MKDGMTLKLQVWRQNGPENRGKLESYTLEDVSSHMSFLKCSTF